MKGVDQLALAKFFGLTSKSRFQKDRERLYLLSEETFAYQGQARIEQEIKGGGKRTPARKAVKDVPRSNATAMAATMSKANRALVSTGKAKGFRRLLGGILSCILS